MASTTPPTSPAWWRSPGRERADLVIGVRDVRVMPPKSKIGNYFSRFLFFLGTGRYLPDTQSGFRLLSRIARRIAARRGRLAAIRDRGGNPVETVTRGYIVATLEIPTIYFDKNRRTHFDPVWDSMRVLAVLGRHALSALAVTAVDFIAFLLLLPHVSGNVVRANILARVLAVVAHCVLRRRFVFRAKGRVRLSEAVRYVAIVLANLTLTTAMLFVFRRWGASPISAKILAQVGGFLVAFVVLDRFGMGKLPDECPSRTPWHDVGRCGRRALQSSTDRSVFFTVSYA